MTAASRIPASQLRFAASERAGASLLSKARLNFGREQLAQMLIELAERIGIRAEQRQMAVDRVDWPELSIGNQSPFGLAIGGWEKHVRRHRHDVGLGFDATQCSPQVAT